MSVSGSSGVHYRNNFNEDEDENDDDDNDDNGNVQVQRLLDIHDDDSDDNSDDEGDVQVEEEERKKFDPKEARSIRPNPNPPTNIGLESALNNLSTILPFLNASSTAVWDGNHLVNTFHEKLSLLGLKKDADYHGMRNQAGSSTVIERSPLENVRIWKCTTNPNMELQVTGHDSSALQFIDKAEIWVEVGFNYLSSKVSLSTDEINGIYEPPLAEVVPEAGPPVRTVPEKYI
jgi:hypothetical protein